MVIIIEEERDKDLWRIQDIEVEDIYYKVFWRNGNPNGEIFFKDNLSVSQKVLFTEFLRRKIML